MPTQHDTPLNPLLLVVHTEHTSDDRWWSARCAFGGIGGGVGNIVRQVATWTDDPVIINQVTTPSGT